MTVVVKLECKDKLKSLSLHTLNGRCSGPGLDQVLLLYGQQRLPQERGRRVPLQLILVHCHFFTRDFGKKR